MSKSKAQLQASGSVVQLQCCGASKPSSSTKVEIKDLRRSEKESERETEWVRERACERVSAWERKSKKTASKAIKIGTSWLQNWTPIFYLREFFQEKKIVWWMFHSDVKSNKTKRNEMIQNTDRYKFKMIQNWIDAFKTHTYMKRSQTKKWTSKCSSRPLIDLLSTLCQKF